VADVCISLGLDVVGEDEKFDVSGCGCVGSLFSGESIIIKGITKLIRCTIGNEHDDVDNVCRWYILLCFGVLYFPRNLKCVCNMPFRLLENIDTLMKYNWGSAIHTFLVNGLSHAHLVHCKPKNQHFITLAGYVVVLQVMMNPAQTHFKAQYQNKAQAQMKAQSLKECLRRFKILVMVKIFQGPVESSYFSNVLRKILKSR